MPARPAREAAPVSTPPRVGAKEGEPAAHSHSEVVALASRLRGKERIAPIRMDTAPCRYLISTAPNVIVGDVTGSLRGLLCVMFTVALPCVQILSATMTRLGELALSDAFPKVQKFCVGK